MSQPEIVRSDLGDERVVAHVDLGGEDGLYVTPTRTLLYRAEGLLSDESVEEFSHGAERITVSEGRRKAKVTLDYGLDGERTISLPTSRLDRALQPIVRGVLRENGVLDADESIAQLFRFKELTVVVAGERVVRHIGSGLWDQEFESYHYSDVTDLEFEDGSVNTSVVLTVDGQRERFKTPNEDARAVRSALESTLLSYWDVDSIEGLRAATTPEESDPESAEAGEEEDVSFGDGPDPLFADPAAPEDRPENATRAPDDGGPEAGSSPDSGAVADRTDPRAEATDPDADTIARGTAESADAGTAAESTRSEAGARGSEAGTEPTPSTEVTDSPAQNGSDAGSPGPGTGAVADERMGDDQPGEGFEGSGFEAAAPATDEQVFEELAALREVVERQNEELVAQRELIERLIEELRRGR
ncbi:DUF7115 domain-containing protein [Halobellus ruber]|uniref:DUF7115 domain-containing protein n=1 Tax=Halobellus ruber TaxID=2761102 RepID=A0A7J9SGH1_9EURY|nr:hypothetical protein [Halobellus ruber]MBB6645086.1 hypothetical protein [Halobellus ruber]